MPKRVDPETTALIEAGKALYRSAPVIHCGSFSNLGKPEDVEETRRIEELKRHQGSL